MWNHSKFLLLSGSMSEEEDSVCSVPSSFWPAKRFVRLPFDFPQATNPINMTFIVELASTGFFSVTNINARRFHKQKYRKEKNYIFFKMNRPFNMFQVLSSSTACRHFLTPRDIGASLGFDRSWWRSCYLFCKVQYARQTHSYVRGKISDLVWPQLPAQLRQVWCIRRSRL